MCRIRGLRVTGRYSTLGFSLGGSWTGLLERGGYEIRPSLALSYDAAWLLSENLTVAGQAGALPLDLTVDNVWQLDLSFSPEIRFPIHSSGQESYRSYYWVEPQVSCGITDGYDRSSSCGFGASLGLRGHSEDQLTTYEVRLEKSWKSPGSPTSLHMMFESRF
jgi:hypothetical protein